MLLSKLTINAFNITKEQQLDVQMRIEVFRETVKYLQFLCNSDSKNRMKIYLIKVKTRSESMHSVYYLAVLVKVQFVWKLIFSILQHLKSHK